MVPTTLQKRGILALLATLLLALLVWIVAAQIHRSTDSDEVKGLTTNSSTSPEPSATPSPSATTLSEPSPSSQPSSTPVSRRGPTPASVGGSTTTQPLPIPELVEVLIPPAATPTPTPTASSSGQATLTSLNISSGNIDTTARTAQFTATGTYSDGSTKNLTSQVKWTIASPTHSSTISSSGLYKAGRFADSNTIYASFGNMVRFTNIQIPE